MKLMVRLFLAFAFVFCGLAQYTPLATATHKSALNRVYAQAGQPQTTFHQNTPSYKAIDTPPGITDDYDGTSQEDDQNEEEETEDNVSPEQFFADTQYIAGVIFSLITVNAAGEQSPVAFVDAARVSTPVGRCILYQVFRI
jgi:hypothetical protein